MPRLIFSSLPPDLTTEKLSEVLGNLPPGVSPPSHLHQSNPRATDIKVLLNKNGRSRRMAFVGYKSEQEADWIKDVWNGAWVNNASGKIGGSRISVDWAKTVQQCAKAPLSTSTSENDPNARSAKRRKTDTNGLVVNPSLKMDPDHLSFVTLMNPGKSKSLVQDILDIPPAPLPDAKLHDTAVLEPTQVESIASDHQGKAQEELQPSAGSDRSSPPPVIGDDDDLDDKAYLAKRMKRNLGESLGSQSQPDPVPVESSRQWEQEDLPELAQSPQNPDLEEPNRKDEQLSTEDLILESGRLFLRNLPYSVTEDEILQLFEPYAPVTQVHIPLDTNRGPKGLAYVSFQNAQNAVTAFKALDQTDFQGRLLHIIPAVTRNSRNGDVISKNSVKSDKELKRKAESQKGFNWASLYMNPDAVVSSVSDRLKISKSDLLDSNDQSAAVKLALAETSVVNETKQFFEDNGIDTEVFNQVGTPRSPTTLLVKNIPYGTTQSVVKSMFAKHGRVSQLLMPPTGTIAIVEMAVKEGARDAFRSLAYKRIGNSVIYLEKAPKGLWKSSSTNEPDPQVDSQEGTNAKPAEEEQGEAGSTLFVKNLSFATTSETLSTCFRNIAGYLFSRIQTKPNPKNPSSRLSMGFGFVGFKTADQAKRALKVMQGTLVDGHALELKFANQNTQEGPEELQKANSSNTNKLIIKNLPFEINKKELYNLFESFGKLKTIRIPKKVDRKSRGFGFVEYVSANSAKDAIKSLKHSHLLGRHLVIEYANKNDQSIEQLRTQTGAELLNGRFELQKTKFKGLSKSSADEDFLVDE